LSKVSKLKQLLFPENRPKALLALADGRTFFGYSFGAEGSRVGELVFNTAMTGYQEILSDPSYANQLVTLTYPHIGNTGLNVVDNDSAAIHATGLVVRDYHAQPSSCRSQSRLSEYLKAHQVVAIAGIDTRELTNYLRDNGAMQACLMTGEIDVEKAVSMANGFTGLESQDLAKTVTVAEATAWTEGRYDLMAQQFNSRSERPYKVVCYDFGLK